MTALLVCVLCAERHLQSLVSRPRVTCGPIARYVGLGDVVTRISPVSDLRRVMLAPRDSRRYCSRTT